MKNHNPKRFFNKDQLVTEFDYIYSIAADEKRREEKLSHSCFENRKDEFARSERNIDLEISYKKIACFKYPKLELFVPLAEGRVTPIGLLACQGNHQAVSFLLSAGSSAELAIQGYQIGGLLKNEKDLQKILHSIPDISAQERLKEASAQLFRTSICKIL